MNRLSRIFILAFVFSGCAAETVIEERLSPSREAIHGGTETTCFPQVGSIGVSNGTESGRCTGTLIAPDLVLLASHCLEGMVRPDGTVNGSFSAQGTSSSVSSAYVLPGACDGTEPGGTRKDVAVLRLATPITSIAPARIAGADPTAGASVNALGYGVNETGSSGTRRIAAMTVESVADGVITTRGVDGSPCSGDSGGPLLAPARCGLAGGRGAPTVYGVLSQAADDEPCSVGGRNEYASVQTPAFRDFLNRVQAGTAPTASPDFYRPCCEPSTMPAPRWCIIPGAYPLPCPSGPPGSIEPCLPCRSGMERCLPEGVWSTCEGAVAATPEVCGNGVDEDCSGVADDAPMCSDPCSGSSDPCCGSPDPCCGSSDPCCGSWDECCGSTDPCCGSNDECCGNPDPCCGSWDPCCGSSDPCCGSSDACCGVHCPPDSSCVDGMCLTGGGEVCVCGGGAQDGCTSGGGADHCDGFCTPTPGDPDCDDDEW